MWSYCSCKRSRWCAITPLTVSSCVHCGFLKPRCCHYIQACVCVCLCSMTVTTHQQRSKEGDSADTAPYLLARTHRRWHGPAEKNNKHEHTEMTTYFYSTCTVPVWQCAHLVSEECSRFTTPLLPRSLLLWSSHNMVVFTLPAEDKSVNLPCVYVSVCGLVCK